MFTVQDVLTSSGKYMDRIKSSEVTPEILHNIDRLLAAINPFLAELGLTNCKISSGFRTSQVNSSIPNAAKKSLHMQGLAVDIEDPTGSIDKLIMMRPELKHKYGIWQEEPTSTPTWAHCDVGARPDRPSRTFNP